MQFSALLHAKYKVITQHDDDDEIGTGKHALTTDKSGKFWGSAGAGGVFYSTSTKKFLLAFRSAHVNEPHTWGVWGGAIDGDETPAEAIKREIREETGYKGDYKLIPSYVYKKGDFQYHNYIIEVKNEFKPKLCWETENFGWFGLDEFPTPLHFGLKALLPYLKKQEIKSMSLLQSIKNKYQVEVKALAQAVHLSEIPAEYKHLPVIARGNTSIILEKDPKTVIMVTRDSMKKDWLHMGIGLAHDFKFHDIKAKNRAFKDLSLYSIEMPKLYKPNNENQSKIRKEVAFFEKARRAVGGRLYGKDKLPELVEYYEKNGMEKSIFITLFNFLMDYYPEQWSWDIARRQFAQDAEGNIILLDPIANKEMLDAMFTKS